MEALKGTVQERGGRRERAGALLGPAAGQNVYVLQDENNRPKKLTALCWLNQTHLYSCNAYLQESNAV